MKRKTIVVNLMGGPGTGKSTLCGGIFTELKRRGVDCEMALEYVKDLVWEESLKKIENQQYIFGKQHNRLFRLDGKVEVIITDSPLLNSIIYYTGDNPYFCDNVMWEFKKLNSLNYYISRTFDYVENGRMQTLDEAVELDNKYHSLLTENNIPFYTVASGLQSLHKIVDEILQRLEK